MNTPKIIDRGRGPELAGTRFTVFDIIPMWKKGRPPQYIAAIYGLSEEEVATLIQYIEAHKDELMPMNDEIEAWVARGNPPELAARLQALEGTARARQDELRRKRLQEGNGECHPE
jgi:uncharacterized protein (DUF433 family)